MHITDKLLKPITETSYLTAENVRRYRAILRFFYLQYEKINYWMEPEEVWRELSSHAEFKDYTPDQCKQDFNALVGWNNLIPIQDTKKVNSIEAFKNRQFRYQLTEYTVEIERMVIRLENLFVEGASLEPTLLERIRDELKKLSSISCDTPAVAYSWWNNLNSDFVRLNQNYQDYMRQMNSARAEELMKTREFLVFKDKLVDYLRNFVRGLQQHTAVIEKQISGADQNELHTIFGKVLEYELSIPRIEGDVNKDAVSERITGRWVSLRNWFVPEATRESEVSRLFDMTNESIRKITRYASQISEQYSGGANRKEEYKQLSNIFASCSTTTEAHCFASVVFGVEKPLHLKGEFQRITDSLNSGVYDEPPFTFHLAPKTRLYKEKFERSHIREHREEKARVRLQAIERLKWESDLLERYIKSGRLSFGELPVIEPEARSIMLHLLSKALENVDGEAKTDEGREYRILNREEKARCILRCNDGAFKMPSFTIEFKDDLE